MKRLLPILILAVCLFQGCNDDSSTANPESTNNGATSIQWNGSSQNARQTTTRNQPTQENNTENSAENSTTTDIWQETENDSERNQETCNTNCENKVCGDDGCGGLCGTCPEGDNCIDGSCSDAPCSGTCANKQCGDDGCGISCGICPIGQQCLNGTCSGSECSPDCSGKSCGNDGCGGSCGTCPADKICENGTCSDAPCTPDCDNKACGDDGCGNSCGSCDSGYECNSGTCEYDICSSDPCAVPPEDAGPLLCTAGESCDSDADCLNGSWVFENTCNNNKCVYEGLRACENNGECYQWCMEFFAESYATVPGFSYCEDSLWDCSPLNDCSDSISICQMLEKCSTSDDCIGNWMSTSTCVEGKCVLEPRTCETSNDCYEGCKELYASSYAIDGAFNYCEQQLWSCSEPNGCDNKPKTCSMHQPCLSDSDCSSLDNWTNKATCDEGKCITELKACETPAMCYDDCVQFYAEFIGAGIEWTYCEDQIWTCD